MNGDDDALEALWKKEYSLQELVSADKFKSYDDLKTRLEYVLGNKSRPAAPRFEEEDTSRGSVAEVEEARVPTRTPVAVAASSDEDEDDALSYFQQLAES